MAGFTKQQIKSLEGFIDRKLNALFDRLQDEFRSSAPPPAPLALLPTSPPASLPAPQPYAQPTPSELPPLPPTNPPSPPPPSVEVLEEVEYTLKHRASKASKAVPTIRVSKSSENCIGWPPKSGGIYMSFSRDEEPDAWYTTMLNHRQKLIGALPHLA